MNFIAPKHFTAFTGIFIALSVASAGHAKDFVVDAPECETSSGSLYVDRGANAEAWQALGAADPANFIEAMIKESGCYTVVSDPQAAKYILIAGALTKKQFGLTARAFRGEAALSTATVASNSPYRVLRTRNPDLDCMQPAGGGGYSSSASGGGSSGGGRSSALGSLIGGLIKLGSNKMRHSYMQINDAQTGALVARGFGRNNRTDLSYSHWEVGADGAAAVREFNLDKKSKITGGSIINAYFDMRKPQNQYAQTTSYAGTPKPKGRNVTISTVSAILSERAKNGERFFYNYGQPTGGKDVILRGYVVNSSARGGWVNVASSKRPSASPTQWIKCQGLGNPEQILTLDRGQAITISGNLMALGRQYKSTGFPNFLAIPQCSVKGF